MRLEPGQGGPPPRQGTLPINALHLTTARAQRECAGAGEREREFVRQKVEARMRITGGARVGWMNASWPLAKLSASATELSVSGLLIGSYTFAPEDVAALESYGSIPIVGQGVRIVHTRPDYPTKIIFWSFRDPERVVGDIRLAGFFPAASSAAVLQRSGMPFRWNVVILLVIVWNILFLLDGFVPWREPKPPGPFVQLALILVFSSAVATQRSKKVQALVLQPGRSIREVRPVVILLQVVSGFMLVGFTLLRLLDPRAG